MVESKYNKKCFEVQPETAHDRDIEIKFQQSWSMLIIMKSLHDVLTKTFFLIHLSNLS